MLIIVKIFNTFTKQIAKKNLRFFHAKVELEICLQYIKKKEILNGQHAS